MKKFLLSALMFAGFVACSTDSELNETVAPDVKSSFKVFASQESFDATRVSIELDGQDRRTVLKWEDSDKIKLSAQKNAAVGNLEMSITEISADRRNATFQANSSILPVEGDLYYACYQANGRANLIEQEIENEKHYGVYYTVPATQSGLAKDAIVLYATGKEAEGEGGIPMQFSAVNSILYVTVDDAPAAGFSELTLTDFNGKYISGDVFHYGANKSNFDSLQGTSITIPGSEANGYLTNAIYIMLPGNLDLETGYILTYTTQSGTVMSFAFNAGTLKEGYIYEAQVKWTLPSVTLGAKTTYSYASTDPKTANSMGGGAAAGSGTTIFFDENYKSSIDGVQNAMVDAMIEDCGFIVDGTYYRASEDKVTREGKEFYMPNLTGQTKTDHSVQAFIKIKHNDTIITSAPETLSVTGIPYSVSLTSQPSDWSFSGDYRFSGSGTDALAGQYLRFKGDSDNSADSAITPKFYIPSNVNVKATADCYHYCSNAFASSKNATIYINICNGSRPSSTSNGTTYKQSLNYGDFGSYNDAVADLTLTNANCHVGITHSTPKVTGTRWMCVKSFKVEYR